MAMTNSNSETTPVRFAFHFPTPNRSLHPITPDSKKDDPVIIERHCPLPSMLLSAEAAATNPEYGATYVAALEKIFKEHETELKTNAAGVCEVCSKPAVHVLTTPFSYVHMPEDPHLNVLVSPLCGSDKCEEQARALMGALSNEGAEDEDPLKQSGSGLGEKQSTVIGENDDENGGMCMKCGATEDLKRCKGCGRVRYCSKECQKNDWKLHRLACGKMWIPNAAKAADTG